MKVFATKIGHDGVTVRNPGEVFDMPEGSTGSWFLPYDEQGANKGVAYTEDEVQARTKEIADERNLQVDTTDRKQAIQELQSRAIDRAQTVGELAENEEKKKAADQALTDAKKQRAEAKTQAEREAGDAAVTKATSDIAASEAALVKSKERAAKLKMGEQQRAQQPPHREQTREQRDQQRERDQAAKRHA